MSGHAPDFSTVASEASGHLPQLDGLRGLAIFLVMLHHFTDGLTHESFIGRALLKLAYAGWSGVDLFFVLSGFLITGILLRAKGTPHYYRNFYMRRALRIFPLYYGVLAVMLVLLPVFLPRSAALATVAERQWGLWSYLTNVVLSWHGKWVYDVEWVKLGHFWSLAVEEHFYLVWPTLVLLLPRRALLWLCAGCLVTALGLRILLVGLGADHLAIYTLTPCRMDGLALGGLLAVVAGRTVDLRPLQRPARWIGGACVLALGVVLVRYRVLDEQSPLMHTAGYTLLAMMYASMLVLSLGNGRLGRLLSRPLPRLLGKYSYGIYVFHVPLLPLFGWLFAVERLAGLLHSQGAAIAVRFLLCSGVTVGLAMLTWHAYESRFLRLKRLFAYRGTGAGVIPGASAAVGSAP